MIILDITQSTLDQILKSEFTVLFFYAEGCHHCELAKPVFHSLSELYPKIQFLKSNFSTVKKHYEQHAEDVEDLVYETSNDGTVTAIKQVNEDGTPKMVKKYSFPSFYVYHSKAADEFNPYGFIGGFDGNNPEESQAIIGEIANLLPNE